MKTLIMACALTVLGAGSASADCYHSGQLYSVGDQICDGGWQQECTHAGYWKAIGQCMIPDAGPKGGQVRLVPGAGDGIGDGNISRLVAAALDVPAKD